MSPWALDKHKKSQSWLGLNEWICRYYQSLLRAIQVCHDMFNDSGEHLVLYVFLPFEVIIRVVWNISPTRINVLFGPVRVTEKSDIAPHFKYNLVLHISTTFQIFEGLGFRWLSQHLLPWVPVHATKKSPSIRVIHPWKINMEPTNHPWKERKIIFPTSMRTCSSR